MQRQRKHHQHQNVYHPCISWRRGFTETRDKNIRRVGSGTVQQEEKKTRSKITESTCIVYAQILKQINKLYIIKKNINNKLRKI